MIGKIIVALFTSMMMVTVALAGSLTQPKADGLIGEQADGYIGFVTSNVPSDVRKLVAEVNANRKAGYKKIAKSQGTSLSDVERVGGNKAIEKTVRGNYIRDSSGRWRKK